MLSISQLTEIQKSIKSSHYPEEAYLIWKWETVIFNCKAVGKNAMSDTFVGTQKISKGGLS